MTNSLSSDYFLFLCRQRNTVCQWFFGILSLIEKLKRRSWVGCTFDGIKYFCLWVKFLHPKSRREKKFRPLIFRSQFAYFFFVCLFLSNVYWWALKLWFEWILLIIFYVVLCTYLQYERWKKKRKYFCDWESEMERETWDGMNRIETFSLDYILTFLVFLILFILCVWLCVYFCFLSIRISHYANEVAHEIRRAMCLYIHRCHVININAMTSFW